MITKEEFDSLYSDDITKKEYDRIISEIDKQFIEIANYLVIKSNPVRSWFDYGNGSYEIEGAHGHFDPKEYGENIEVGGEYIELPEPYDYGFPTRWLWEKGWKEEMRNEIKKVKEKLKEDASKRKANRAEKEREKQKLIEVVKSKLTKKELSVVSFK